MRASAWCRGRRWRYCVSESVVQEYAWRPASTPDRVCGAACRLARMSAIICVMRRPAVVRLWPHFGESVVQACAWRLCQHACSREWSGLPRECGHLHVAEAGDGAIVAAVQRECGVGECVTSSASSSSCGCGWLCVVRAMPTSP